MNMPLTRMNTVGLLHYDEMFRFYFSGRRNISCIMRAGVRICVSLYVARKFLTFIKKKITSPVVTKGSGIDNAAEETASMQQQGLLLLVAKESTYWQWQCENR